MTRRRPYHHGDLRRALVDAALELVGEQGVAPLTLREVARRAGVSHAAPYHHFADRAALLAAVAEEGFRALTAAMLRARDRAGPDPRRRLQEIGVAYVEFATGHPAHFRVMFSGELAGQQADCPGLDEAGASSYGVLLDALRACVGGEPGPALAAAAWSIVHGLAVLWIDGPLRREAPGKAGVAGLAREVTRLFGRTLEPPPRKPTGR
jgi:AcrR family transcriptional regulator